MLAVGAVDEEKHQPALCLRGNTPRTCFAAVKPARGPAMVQFLERFTRNLLCILWAWRHLPCCSTEVAPHLFRA